MLLTMRRTRGLVYRKRAICRLKSGRARRASQIMVKAVEASPRVSSLSIDAIPMVSNEPHAGWLAINLENGSFYFYRVKAGAIKAARAFKAKHDGDWHVKATTDGGPWMKPPPSHSLV